MAMPPETPPADCQVSQSSSTSTASVAAAPATPPPKDPSDPVVPVPEIVGHLSFRDWEEVRKLQPKAKPFGRWHDIAIAVMNFLLGTVVAGSVAWVLHTNEKRDEARERREEARAQTALERQKKQEQDEKNRVEAAKAETERAAAQQRQDLKDAQNAQFRVQEQQEIAKERRELRLKETAAFLSATADNINKPLSQLNGAIRQGGLPPEEWFGELSMQVGLLFTKRLNAKVMSDAYMNGNTFWRDYDFITWQIRYLSDALRDSALGKTPTNKIEEEARKQMAELGKGFQARGYKPREYASQESLPRPREVLMHWSSLIWDFTSESLGFHLKMALKEPPPSDGE